MSCKALQRVGKCEDSVMTWNKVECILMQFKNEKNTIGHEEETKKVPIERVLLIERVWVDSCLCPTAHEKLTNSIQNATNSRFSQNATNARLSQNATNARLCGF